VRDETVALHGDYEGGPARAVAVPTYKTVAHDFENAIHAGAVLTSISGPHYNSVNNPTVGVVEQRMAKPERGTVAVAVSSGAARFVTAPATSQRWARTSCRSSNFTGPHIRILQLIDHNTEAVFLGASVTPLVTS
jgi:cystathionine beta-lyase/cystathionine gamma-synthase